MDNNAGKGQISAPPDGHGEPGELLLAADSKELMLEWLHALQLCGGQLAPGTLKQYEDEVKKSRNKKGVLTEMGEAFEDISERYEALMEIEREKQRELDLAFYTPVEMMNIDELEEQIQAAEADLKELRNKNKKKKIPQAEEEVAALRKELKKLRGEGPKPPPEDIAGGGKKAKGKEKKGKDEDAKKGGGKKEDGSGGDPKAKKGDGGKKGDKGGGKKGDKGGKGGKKEAAEPEVKERRTAADLLKDPDSV
jgi:TolA-binding protein